MEEIPHYRVTEEQAVGLDAPLTMEEIRQSLKILPGNKAPEPDSLLVQILKVYRHVHMAELLHVYNVCSLKRALTKSLREALIVLILNPDKDPLEMVLFHPISL